MSSTIDLQSFGEKSLKIQKKSTFQLFKTLHNDIDGLFIE